MRTLFFLFFFGLQCFSTNALFWKLPFGKRFSIQEKEIRKTISYSLPVKQQQVINKINGFYGLIGPDKNITNVKNVFDLFTGDGMIQGIFFDHGELIFVKHMVRTEKLEYEMENGKIPNNNFMKFIFTIGNKLKVLPNPLGLANTAFMNVGNRFYSLYERDVPYEIDICFQDKTVSTIKKVEVKDIEHFSAHTKVSDTIETIDYQVATNKVTYFQLNENLEVLRKKDMPMNYMPVIHDIISTQHRVVLTDSPIVMDMKSVLHKSLPVILNHNERTWIHVLNKTDFSIERFSTNESFYIFHYADYKETANTIEIYASHYDSIDFSELNITGRYRKLVIDKYTKKVSIIKNRDLENLDIEFPIKFEDKVLFRSMKNKIINGFVVCKDLQIMKQIEFENRFICGEPAIENIDNVPHLICFTFDLTENEKGYLLIMNMHTYEQIEVPLALPLTIGFHSAFYKYPYVKKLARSPLTSMYKLFEELDTLHFLFTADIPLW
jgi:hypothetical protein